MHQGNLLGCNWARGGVAGSGVVRRAHPASGAQWNVQVVRGKVNGKCLWNACKALSVGLLLMILGGAMATIGYYADHLSIAQEIRGNHTIKIKNESRGFHLNNLSYAGPIVMGVGGFIVVAACVMTFEARDSAGKVVPARLKTGSGIQCTVHRQGEQHSTLGSLRTQVGVLSGVAPIPIKISADRHAVTQSFMQFSKGLVIEGWKQNDLLKVSQNSISKSPSAPDLIDPHINEKKSPPPHPHRERRKAYRGHRIIGTGCNVLNPSLLHRHALSVDETTHTYRHESLQGTGSQCSMALDLHLECPVTLRIRDRRRNPLMRQGRVDEDEKHLVEAHRSTSPRLQKQHYKTVTSTSPTFCPDRRSSNTSDCTHRARTKKRECPHSRGRLERAISSDSRLIGTRCFHHTPRQNSTEVPGVSSSDTDIAHTKLKYFLTTNK
ncbi:PREDICTED: uncharacterized protein LOC108560403 isoform X2 [Nicrophorus vespilloides]|uniref:Uncharacterized protein LOC108560403 isoform X2 n=1 Tax=Nicrophorus vespilloides TaxID=110193 RepID=A0ABM1MFS0_NICVS|nr:PREDICTED: uncharacterized protein LOC108560403 isoform X2 [Nicrophorus vespilloides]